MTERTLALPEDPARWKVVLETDTLVLLTRGRHQLKTFREGEEISVPLVSPAWALTSLGVVERGEGFLLFGV